MTVLSEKLQRRLEKQVGFRSYKNIFNIDSLEEILTAQIAQHKSMQPHGNYETWRRFDAIARYYGLLGYDLQNLRGIGEVYGVTGARAQQLVTRGFKKLRHPSVRSKWLTLEDYPNS